MEFVQVIEFTTGKYDEIRAIGDAFIEQRRSVGGPKPVSVLQLTGVMATSTPKWYVTLQGVVGVAQFAIGLAMLAGYRRAGPWGEF